MHSIKKQIFMACVSAALTFIPLHLRAEEESKGESKAEGKEEAKSEGKGNLKNTLPPWVELENKTQELQSKIRSKQGNINALIIQKNQLPENSSELKNVIKDIVKEHKELRKFAEDYDKNINLLKYRFPERNGKLGHNYDRIEVKSVDVMEESLGVDGKLSRNLKRMRKHFGTEDAHLAKEKRTQSQGGKKNPQAEPSIEDSDSIILQK